MIECEIQCLNHFVYRNSFIVGLLINTPYHLISLIKYFSWKVLMTCCYYTHSTCMISLLLCFKIIMMLKCGVIFLMIVCICEAKTQEILCPDYCACDIWNDFRRAICQNRKLYSMEINMPPQVQILDMSYNQVSELWENVFLETNLTDLKLLNLSHNKVGQIHLFGFEGLEELKTLDLSFNNVQYFNEQWFVSLRSLQELYLRGNNLISINDEAKLNIPHLKILDISRCNIEYLHHGTLRQLHNLQSLDLSDNILSVLHFDVIHPLRNLRTLLAENNPFKCESKMMTRLRNYTHIKGIQYEDSCESHLNLSNNVEKFQRMVIAKPVTPEKNSWLYDEEDTKIVHEIVCKQNETLNSTRNIVDDHLMKIIDLSPSLVLLATLICGINIGLLFGCLCQFNSKPKAGSFSPDDEHSTPLRVFQRQNSVRNSINTKPRSRTRSAGSRKMFKEDRSDLLSNEGPLYDSTPVLTRKIFE